MRSKAAKERFRTVSSTQGNSEEIRSHNFVVCVLKQNINHIVFSRYWTNPGEFVFFWNIILRHRIGACSILVEQWNSSSVQMFLYRRVIPLSKVYIQCAMHFAKIAVVVKIMAFRITRFPMNWVRNNWEWAVSNVGSTQAAGILRSEEWFLCTVIWVWIESAFKRASNAPKIKVNGPKLSEQTPRQSGRSQFVYL